MNNVVEGKNINSIFSKIVGLGKALLISPTTLSAIDGKPLVMRYKEENEQMAQKEQFISTPETPLVDERYATNPIVKGAETVFNVPNSTGPIPQPQSFENQTISQSVGVTPEIPPIIENNPIQQPVGPNIENPSTVEIPEIKPLTNSTPGVEIHKETQIETPIIPNIEIPVLKGGDEIVDAINTQMLTPEEPKVETSQSLQTPQEAFKAENVTSESKAYIDVLDKIEKVRQIHLDALEGIKIETNRRFEEIKKKYNEDFDNLSRAVEEARSNDMKAIKDTIDEYDTYINQNYNGITVNGR